MLEKIEKPVNTKKPSSLRTKAGEVIKDQPPSLMASSQDHRFFRLIQSGVLDSDFFGKTAKEQNKESDDYFIEIV